MPREHLVTVYSTAVLTQAQALRDLLRAEGMWCVLGGILRARARGVPVLEIQIQVPAASVARARQVIGSHDRVQTDTCPLAPPTAGRAGGPEGSPLDAPEATPLRAEEGAPSGLGVRAAPETAEAASRTGTGA